MSKSEVIRLRVEPEMKTKVETCAKAEGRTVSNFIETILLNYMKEKEMTIIEKAAAIDEFENTLPNLSVGDICKLSDVWNGEGECPEDSYSYQLTDTDWINYEFKVVDENINPLDTIVKITGIALL